MSEVTNNNEAPALTAEAVQEMISSAVGGYAAKSERQFNKMFESVSEQMKALNKPAQATEGGTTGNTQADPEIAALKRTVADLTQSHKAAEEKALKAEQKQVLSEALSIYTFASDKAREVAAQVLESQMKRSQEGKYFINDQDLKTAVAEQMKALPGLLAPLNVGSSGATGTSKVEAGGVKITPNMTKEQIVKAYEHFQKTLV